MVIHCDSNTFSPKTAQPVKVIDPALNRTFWHGTQRKHLSSIFESGLDPVKTNIYDHVCLASDPAIAILFGRLEGALRGKHGEENDLVLIRIDGALLDPSRCVVEAGAVRVSAYGESLPLRNSSALRALGDDWRAFHEATETLGYLDAVPVTPNMVDERGAGIPIPSVEALLVEMNEGHPGDEATQRLVEMLREETSVTPFRMAA